jgi:hypothetical protein
MSKSKQEAKAYDNQNPNSHFDLSHIDYQRLNEPEMYQAYLKVEQEIWPYGRGVDIPGHSGFIFEAYRAIPVRKERYPGMPNTPVDLVGIELIGEPGRMPAPVLTTKMAMKHARDLNSQLPNGTKQIPVKYYLLKKVQAEQPAETA